VKLRRTTGHDDEFIALTRRLDSELRGIYGEAHAAYAPHNIIDTETVVIATIDDVPVGCGCFKRYDDETVELKRFFVDPERRGAGIGRAVIGELERWAIEHGYRAAVLETGVDQPAAIALYERAGYTRAPPYGPYVGMDLSICMRKQLA
jgi:putative acetyltransferase